MINLVTPLLILGSVCNMKITPVFIDPNNLMSFVSSDVFGAVLILVVLISTILCIILGRGDGE